jgi:UDP-glucose 4-epimerase
VKEIVTLFQKHNNCEFDVKYGARRLGDLERSVLDNPSLYLDNIYGIEELVKIPMSML